MSKLEWDYDTRKKIMAVLVAIADGAPLKYTEDSRYVIVENPDATPESIAMRGVDPYLVLDVDALLTS